MFVAEPGFVRVLNSGCMLSYKSPSYIGLGIMALQDFSADLSSYRVVA